MAKQTFTTGQVLTAAQMTSLQQTAMLGGAANAKTASYVLVAADAGDAITMSNASATTITVNTGLFAAGDIVTIINLGAGVSTITAGTATVSTSGSLALAQNQGGVLRFTSASAAIFFQFATPASGDIEGVTAGTGISGGGTSGTVTITNSMATAIDAKGDLVVGTGADAFSRLAVGTNGQVLTADSGEATGLKFATPASGGGMTLLSTTSLSGTSTAITIAPTGYVNLQVLFKGVFANTDNTALSMRLNSDSGNNYTYVDWRRYPGTPAGDFQANRNQNNQFFCSTSIGTSSAVNSFTGAMTIYNCTDTSQINYEFTIMAYNDANFGTFQHSIGKYMASAAITNLTIVNTVNANTLSGTVYVYGVK